MPCSARRRRGSRGNHDSLLEADTVETLVSYARVAVEDVLLWSAINVCDNPLPAQHEVSDVPDFSCFMVDPRRARSAILCTAWATGPRLPSRSCSDDHSGSSRIGMRSYAIQRPRQRPSLPAVSRQVT